MSLRTLMAAAAAVALVPGVCAAADYHAPKNAFGQPDLEGVWTNATITPLQREAKYGERNVLTPQEAAAAEAATQAQIKRADAPTDPNLKVGDLKNADCGADGISGFNCGYNQGWKDPGTKVIDIKGEKRASIIVSPSNGRFPAMTAEAQAQSRTRMQRMMNSYDGPEARAPSERCIVAFGSSSGPPMLPVMYNNNYQIVQTKDEVAIEVEMVHDVRRVRLTGGHEPALMAPWMGDSIGHYEGDTLVVETTNIHPGQEFRGAGPHAKVIERFTRIAPGKILYRWTIDDPETYTAPITGEEALGPAKGQLFEYACHEGNYALGAILAGARRAEKEGKTFAPGGGGEGETR
jgi:hypothetical protein